MWSHCVCLCVCVLSGLVPGQQDPGYVTAHVLSVLLKAPQPSPVSTSGLVEPHPLTHPGHTQVNTETAPLLLILPIPFVWLTSPDRSVHRVPRTRIMNLHDSACSYQGKLCNDGDEYSQLTTVTLGCLYLRGRGRKPVMSRLAVKKSNKSVYLTIHPLPLGVIRRRFWAAAELWHTDDSVLASLSLSFFFSFILRQLLRPEAQLTPCYSAGILPHKFT